jgi:type VI secretion system secreted protein VgrG
MAAFDPAYAAVIRAEGGYQADPADSGNYDSHKKLIGTKYGISAPVLEAYLKRDITVDDMKNLQLSTVRSIYKNLYWDKIKGDSINDQDTAHFLFDWGVNAGVSKAVRSLQESLKYRFGKNISIDGGMGPQTLSALHSSPISAVYADIVERRRQHYKDIAQANPALSKFLPGWLNRLAEFEKKKLSPAQD